MRRSHHVANSISQVNNGMKFNSVLWNLTSFWGHAIIPDMANLGELVPSLVAELGRILSEWNSQALYALEHQTMTCELPQLDGAQRSRKLDPRRRISPPRASCSAARRSG